MSKSWCRNKQHGTTVLEILGALGVSTLMLMGLTRMVDALLEDAEGQQAALYQAQVTGAAEKYINANYPTLVAATPNAATVVAIDVATLKAQNFLATGFATTNAYNQSTCVLVRQPTPGSGKLDSLVTTFGGQKIEDRNIAAVAASAGQGSGYITTAAPTTARGASWSLDTVAYRGVTCPGAGAPALTGAAADGGHLVSSLFYDGPGQLSTDFVYRDAVPGRPELNQINTPLKLANSAVVSEGAACGSVAALAVDSSRDILKCDSDGFWRRVTVWRKPVANYAGLGALPASDKKAGDVRMVLDKKRAFMYDGTNWVALAVDQNGDMAVERDLTVGRDAMVASYVRATEVYASDGVLARVWAWFPNLQLGDMFDPGDTCNRVHHRADGSVYVDWPVGTTVLDWDNNLMTCHYDQTFRYQNGTYTP
ncbi:shufflon system plasmid conjugative transfer pilus tip adhesin PilV [Herbaspirillum sp. HC18]|nr:shufflon system plasmid conjugative transfer pilus tip adhesin PilV [Herbaspirillum sp. HC18]